VRLKQITTLYMRVLKWKRGGRIKSEKGIQDVYPDERAWCYGYGWLNKDRHHLRMVGKKIRRLWTLLLIRNIQGHIKVCI